VTLLVPCPLHRLVTWVEAAFSVKASLGRGDTMEACLMSLRDRSPLVIRASPASQQMQVGQRPVQQSPAAAAGRDVVVMHMMHSRAGILWHGRQGEQHTR
jgi:hypothetical protein